MIDVAIVDYGTPDLAAQCAGSLTSDLFDSIEIVDAHARGLSYAQAVNGSLAGRHSPYVLALNADTRMLEPPDHVIAIFEENPDIAVIGPRQIDDEQRVTHAGIVGDNLRRQHRFWMHPLADVDRQSNERIMDVPTISGAVYFCRRSAWEEHDGFLETRHFYEETALDFAIRHAGHRVVYTGATTWVHLFNRSPVDGAWRAQMAAESREAFRKFCDERGIERD